jgi:hypothetical protein
VTSDEGPGRRFGGGNPKSHGVGAIFVIATRAASRIVGVETEFRGHGVPKYNLGTRGGGSTDAVRACSARAGQGTLGSATPNPKSKMKPMKLVPFLLIASVLGLALPARGDTMSVPSKEKPVFTIDVPSKWKPIGDAKDGSVEATAPGDIAYLSAWTVNTADDDAVESAAKDLKATLKDSMKSLDPEASRSKIKVNGRDITVVKGSGVDKREGSKVQFRVAIFATGLGAIGIVYTDYDDDAPDETMKALQGIIESIKVAKKE